MILKKDFITELDEKFFGLKGRGAHGHPQQ
jgi:hypothetical protein